MHWQKREEKKLIQIDAVILVFVVLPVLACCVMNGMVLILHRIKNAEKKIENLSCTVVSLERLTGELVRADVLRTAKARGEANGQD